MPQSIFISCYTCLLDFSFVCIHIFLHASSVFLHWQTFLDPRDLLDLIIQCNPHPPSYMSGQCPTMAYYINHIPFAYSLYIYSNYGNSGFLRSVHTFFDQRTWCHIPKDSYIYAPCYLHDSKLRICPSENNSVYLSVTCLDEQIISWTVQPIQNHAILIKECMFLTRTAFILMGY